MKGSHSSGDRPLLIVEIDEAARIVAPLWPLQTFIAVNPLWDLRHLPFADAVAHASQVLGVSGYPDAELFALAYASGRITAADLEGALARAGLHPGDFEAGDLEASDLEPAGYPSCGERHDAAFGTRIAEVVDSEVARWSAAYLAGIVKAADGGGFYQAWISLIGRDGTARRIAGREGRRRLAALPASPEDAITACLDALGISGESRIQEMAAHLARMPGWAGHAKWRSRWAPPDAPGPALHLMDYLAVRFAYEAILVEQARAAAPAPAAVNLRHPAGPFRADSGTDRSPAAPFRPEAGNLPGGDPTEELPRLPLPQKLRIWQDAYESHYRDSLLAALDRQQPRAPAPAKVQAVFCIDTRSEGIRRHLEALGPYETFGFAGFFGLPVRYRAFGSASSSDLCPVLLRPASELAEQPAGDDILAPARELAGRQAVSAIQGAFEKARKGTISSYVLAEATGLLAGPLAAARTLAPAPLSALRSRILASFGPPAPKRIAVEPEEGAMNDEEQAFFAETSLTTMGLTKGFAPIVLLCGHGSTTENNPYASSLDCGACGGNRGGDSARAAAAMLNRPATRRLLSERGISIPESTLFIAGEHDTATDEVVLLDTHLVPPAHLEAVASLQDALLEAGEHLSTERAAELPASGIGRSTGMPAARSADWAQVQPEWGLARNAAFVVGPRTITSGVDLERRCFLHSYDWRLDPDGLALETILTAPMVVAHWINAQYYFSTVDPGILSAGDKTAHNIVAGIGVVLGTGGDLKVGLPLQSVYDGGQPFHEPMRLLTVVQAPKRLLEAVIARNTVLRQLFDGQWVHIAAREGGEEPWSIRTPDGSWEAWVPANTADEEVSIRG